MSFFKRKMLDTKSMQKGVKLISITKPNSVETEQFNTIRTNIQFANVDRDYKSLMVTSSTPSEGKSTVAANLAVSFARQGLKTLIVDTDFRRPTLVATLQIASSSGITNYLTETDFNLNSILYKTSVKNLFALPSGPIPPNPSELLGSRKMNKLIHTLGENFDIVIYDAAPIISVSDGQILSTKVDGTILVVRDGKVEKDAVRQTVNLIKHVKGKILGFILNDVENKSDGYYGYYGYYGTDKGQK